jgi:hypothetical protein
LSWNDVLEMSFFTFALQVGHFPKGFSVMRWLTSKVPHF